ncbi:MAG: hypothetical protein AB1489_14635 [Acidobacteriota bacterium]
MTALEIILIVANVVLAGMLVLLFRVLLRGLDEVRQATAKFGKQALDLQVRMEDKLQRLQNRAEPLMEETQRLVAAAQPTLEQVRQLLAATTPVIIEMQAVAQLAKETATTAKSAATTLKIETESCMAAINATTKELTEMTRDEAESVRELVADARQRAARQVMRVDQIVTRTTDRIDETAAIVQNGVLKPVNEIAAVLAAVQGFLQVLFAQERKTIDQAYQDEEMFI